jgi:raffinose/stachyose/melibiose transport system substrate-binding protein
MSQMVRTRSLTLISLLVALSMLLGACAAPQAPAPAPTQAPAPAAAAKAPEPTKAPEPAKAPEATKAPEPTKAPAQPTAAPTAVAKAEQITLTMWDIYPEGQPFRKVEDNAIARFNKKFPNVKVNVVSYSINDYKPKLVTSLAAGGKDFDVFQTWGGGQLATYARRGQVLEITDAMGKDNWKDRFAPAALTFVTADGKIWGAPVELATVLMFYNTEMFKANNVSVPKTYDELVASCKTFKSKGIIPISMGLNKASWTGDLLYQYLVTRVGGLEPFRKAITREAGGSFTDPVFVKAGTMLQEMVDAGCFQDGFSGAEYASMRQLLGQEKAAMTIMGSWLPGQISTEFPAFMPKLDYFRFPVVKDGKGVDTDIVGGTNAAFAIAKASKHPAEAIALLQELSSLETASDVLTIAKRLPAAKYTYDAKTVDALTIRVAAELDKATAVQLYYDQSSTPGLANDHLDQLVGLFSNTTTPDKAAAAWEASAKKELQ